MSLIKDHKNNHMIYRSKEYDSIAGDLLLIEHVKVFSHGGNNSIKLGMISTDGINKNRFEIDYTNIAVSNESAMKELTYNGYVVLSSTYIKGYRDYISMELFNFDKSKYTYYHTSLGYTHMKDGTKMFLLGKSKYQNSVSHYIDDNFDFIKGTLTNQMDFIKTTVISNIEMKLALVLSLSSIVMSDLKDYADLGTTVINLNGKSSTGKTTAVQFMASIWGNPKISNRGIVRTFNATKNSLVETFTGINGVPIIIDDATSLIGQDLSDLVYSIAAGEDKLRLNSDIEIRESKGNWSGIALITAETSIKETSTLTSGLIPRLIELEQTVWTESAKHSTEIKKGIYENYGCLGKDFSEKYLELSDKEKRNEYEKSLNEIDALIINRNTYTDRIAAKLASIYLTAKLIDYYYPELQLNLEEIRKYIVSLENDKDVESSMEERAFSIIKELIIKNQKKLERVYTFNNQEKKVTSKSSDFIGYIRYDSKNKTNTYVILSSVIKNELKKNNIYQWSNVLRFLESIPNVVKIGTKNPKASETDSKLSAKAIRFEFKSDNDDNLINWYHDTSPQNF